MHFIFLLLVICTKKIVLVRIYLVSSSKKYKSFLRLSYNNNLMPSFLFFFLCYRTNSTTSSARASATKAIIRSSSNRTIATSKPYPYPFPFPDTCPAEFDAAALVAAAVTAAADYYKPKHNYELIQNINLKYKTKHFLKWYLRETNFLARKSRKLWKILGRMTLRLNFYILIQRIWLVKLFWRSWEYESTTELTEKNWPIGTTKW